MSKWMYVASDAAGYEITGEKRLPRFGEFYLAASGAVYRATSDFRNSPKTILVKKGSGCFADLNMYERAANAPEGYEFTGEVRRAEPDEYWLGIDGVQAVIGRSIGVRRILRKIPVDRYVAVRFMNSVSTTYTYIDPSERLAPGDLVLVPVGSGSVEKVAEVTAVDTALPSVIVPIKEVIARLDRQPL